MPVSLRKDIAEPMYVVPGYFVNKFVTEESTKVHLKKEYQLKPLDYPYYARRSTEKQGEFLGLKTFDIAMPQKFVDIVIEMTGVNPCGHVVWSYDKSRGLGEPVGITREGVLLMKIYKHIREKQR